MSKITNGGLDQYGAEPFEQQRFGTAVVEGVNNLKRAALFNALLQCYTFFLGGASYRPTLF